MYNEVVLCNILNGTSRCCSHGDVWSVDEPKLHVLREPRVPQLLRGFRLMSDDHPEGAPGHMSIQVTVLKTQ